MSNYELITSPFEDAVTEVVKKARESLFISTPYIKSYGIELLKTNAKVSKISILTNLSLRNITGESFDFEAFVKLWEHFNDVKVSSLEKLHAKVYIADHCQAIITSANLTRSGLRENYEYGVYIRDESAIAKIKTDIERYSALGNIFEKKALLEIQQDIRYIKQIRATLEQTEQARQLNLALKEKEQNAQIRMLANRVEQKTVNSIFSETIVYLLNKHGAMSTEQLHAFIQEIHPDICDDTVDRIIKGQHFGKKWKHMVRNAQQALKSNNIIKLHAGKWHLINS